MVDQYALYSIFLVERELICGTPFLARFKRSLFWDVVSSLSPMPVHTVFVATVPVSSHSATTIHTEESLAFLWTQAHLFGCSSTISTLLSFFYDKVDGQKHKVPQTHRHIT